MHLKSVCNCKSQSLLLGILLWDTFFFSFLRGNVCVLCMWVNNSQQIIIYLFQGRLYLHQLSGRPFLYFRFLNYWMTRKYTHQTRHAQVHVLRGAITGFCSHKQGIMRTGFSIVYKTAVGHSASQSGAKRGKRVWGDRTGMQFKYRTPSEPVCSQAAVYWLACLQ